MQMTNAGDKPEQFKVINEEMLRAFCAINDPREYLKIPIRRDGHLYATNGHVCIVIKDDPAIYGQESARPDFGFIHRGVADADEFMALDVELPPAEACKHCKGHGKMTKCKSCEGDGEFEFRGNVYDCKECGGEGCFAAEAGPDDETVLCHSCNGLKTNPTQTVRVGHTTFARRYIELLQRLPDIKIWTSKAHPMASAFFIFDGGFGAVMPCKEL